MFKNENLVKLQEYLKKDNIKSYLILTSDSHNNEYVSDYYLSERLFFCPFTGDTGDLLVTQDSAYLFTDGRFFIQAENELKGTNIKLMKIGEKGVLNIPEFIKANNLYPFGVNFNIITKKYYESFINPRCKIIDKDYSQLINDRPKLVSNKVFKLKSNLYTLNYQKKIEKVINTLKEKNVDACLISSLDDIAYLLNIRGSDIKCNPVFYSYLYISIKEGCHLFIDKDKIDFNLDKIKIHKYKDINKFLETRKDVLTLTDLSRLNTNIALNINKIVDDKSPVYLMKCIKDKNEIKNIKEIQILDGVALVKFGYYLKKNLKNNLTEFQYSEKLEEFRRENKRCFDLSFETIAAVGSNGALMHYSATKDRTKVVNSSEIELLVDSGGQYYGGTTDTTRMFALKKFLPYEYKKDYTLTLKSVISLTNTIFLDGCTGQSIDIKAREIMWREGLDYKCGTGHGVGYILNVHEGPNGFRYKKVKERDDGAKIVPGMVTTVEPGVYKENKYGIRIENNLLCVDAFNVNNDNYYKFETITCAPIETRGLIKSMLSEEEKTWLNNYNNWVYKSIKPYIKKDRKLLYYLKNVTKPIR